MSNPVRKPLALLLAGLALLGLSMQSVVAQTVLRANSQWNETHAGSQVDKWWAEEIKKRTNGEVEIKLFFGGALGKAQENLPLLQQGALDMAMMSPGYFPAQLPFHAAPEYPYTGDRFAEDPDRRAYDERYNTRRVTRR